MEKKRIYLDYAATTPVDSRVLKAMLPYFSEKFGNTFSLHSFGQEAKQVLEECREIVANLIGVKAKEIIFTSSATESNNLALKGIALANNKKGRHIIVSQIEHPSVLEAAEWLETQGFEITRLKVDKYGFIDLGDLEKAIKKETILVSIIHASNEIGTIQNIEEIGKICRAKNILFHTDAVQSFGKIPIDVKRMNIDLLTASSHKIYGPKGAACLFIREGIKITPIFHGGGQEDGLRSSTINLPAIVGFSEAVKICQKEMEKEAKRLTVLRDKLIKGILGKIPDSYLNGPPLDDQPKEKTNTLLKRLSNIVNFSFSFVEGETLLIQLDFLGIAVSTGSACSTIKLEPSHVLSAIGLPLERLQGSVRISLGRWTKEKDIDYLLKILPEIVKKLRKISPFKK